MTIEYKITFNLFNGYRCSCCRNSWSKNRTIEILSDKPAKFFTKRANHNLDELRDKIFQYGCDILKELLYQDYGDEFDTSNYGVSYEFFNRDIQNSVYIEWDTPFPLEPDWQQFYTLTKLEIENQDKQRRIKKLEQELKQLKGNENDQS